MRSLWLPGQERRVQEAPARTAPHLLDGISPFVEGVAWIADAGEGPPRPVGGVFRNDFSLAVRFGVLAGHDVMAVWADNSAVLGAFGGHGNPRGVERFKRVLRLTDVVKITSTNLTEYQGRGLIGLHRLFAFLLLFLDGVGHAEAQYF